jgi:hypothetical protein
MNHHVEEEILLLIYIFLVIFKDHRFFTLEEYPDYEDDDDVPYGFDPVPKSFKIVYNEEGEECLEMVY